MKGLKPEALRTARQRKKSSTATIQIGIIYLNSVAPGKAKVSMAELPKDKGITFSKEPVTINIKENLDFKKIDVSDEVKTESQINAKAEDTALGNATEGALKDTQVEIDDVRYDFEPMEIEPGDYPVTFVTEGRTYKIHTTDKVDEGKVVGLKFGKDDIHVMEKTID